MQNRYISVDKVYSSSNYVFEYFSLRFIFKSQPQIISVGIYKSQTFYSNHVYIRTYENMNTFIAERKKC